MVRSFFAGERSLAWDAFFSSAVLLASAGGCGPIPGGNDAAADSPEETPGPPADGDADTDPWTPSTCSRRLTCDSCLATPTCGWCADTAECRPGAERQTYGQACANWIVESSDMCEGLPPGDPPDGGPLDGGPFDSGGDDGVTPPAVMCGEPEPPALPSDRCGLVAMTTAQRVDTVRADPSCAEELIAWMAVDALEYLPAFYPLISAPEATEALFSAWYDHTPVFDALGMRDLWDHLPNAVTACAPLFRCADWRSFALNPVMRGDVFECPAFECLSSAEMLLALPYGGYECTESLAIAVPATRTVVHDLLDILEDSEWVLARRNAARVIGRMASRDNGDGDLLRITLRDEVLPRLIARLNVEPDEDPIQDLIWILDSYYYPEHDIAGRLEALSRDPSRSSSLRFRAISARRRLLDALDRSWNAAEMAFLSESMVSDDPWVRAVAAYAFRVADDEDFTSVTRQDAVDLLQGRWGIEAELVVRVEIAQALDELVGGSRFDGLKGTYEGEHLPVVYHGPSTEIRSSLPLSRLEALAEVTELQRLAFQDIFGAAFLEAVPGDPNDSFTLFIFGTRAEYREYMNAFGSSFASESGGVYLEDRGTLYTWDRTPSESTFTLEELVRHEFSHYLSLRYIFPGFWTDSGYHEEALGWADEGLAETLAGIHWDSFGYTIGARAVHMDRLCDDEDWRGLRSLLSQHAGYDVAGGPFDYSNAWSFVHFMFTERRADALAIYRSFRDSDYSLEAFASLAGVLSIESLEAEWHASARALCEANGY